MSATHTPNCGPTVASSREISRAPYVVWTRRTAVALAVCGLSLLALNLVGMAVPLRSPTIDESYADFARPTTLAFDDAMAQLEALADAEPRELVAEATRVFHYGMAHVPRDDIERDGLSHYRMRVPAWENFVLFALSFLKPDTYRDYEFCSYRKALERGTGRCGQQSMALVGFLAERGLATGFVALGGHAIATAEVAPGEWYILDADFGGVIPMSLARAQANPADVLPHYWSPAARERHLDKAFEPAGNEITYGGPEARYRRACPIERVAYALKWALPLAMLTIALAMWLLARTHGARRTA